MTSCRTEHFLQGKLNGFLFVVAVVVVVAAAVVVVCTEAVV